MRTKHLLTAIMLPALFAACTNDELTTINPSTDAVTGRQMVDVKLSFSADDAATRLIYDGKYKWQENDQIGACLMDVITSDYNDPTKTWSERFDLTNYIQTNYKFTRDLEGAWNTEAKLCEGNYFFCYPYNANKGARDAYKFVAENQTMSNTTKDALMEAFAKNNAFVGYGKVEKSDKQIESLAIDMNAVFGATGFTLKNTGTNTYTIEKIVLRGSKVANEATVNPTACTEAIQYGTAPSTATATEFNVAQYTGDENDAKQFVAGFTAYDKVAALSDVLTYGAGGKTIAVALEGGNVVKTQQSINLIAMVVPTDLTAASNEAVLDIYTDKGIIKGIQLNERYTANSTGGKTTNVLTDVALTSIGTGNKVKVEFDDTSIDVPNTLEINTDADLASLIHWNAKVATPITANLNADVTISKAMYEELAGSMITKATISGSHVVTIAADVPAAALDAFTYSSVSKVVVKGAQNLAANHADLAIEVVKGATLNVTKKATVASVANEGTLNVKADLTATTTTNKGAMTVAAGKKVSALTNNGTVENAGVITTLTSNVAVNNSAATITNTGSIAAGTNNATIINNAGEVKLTTNNGVVFANGKSATVVTTNTNGSIVITKLEDDGNYKASNGAIVQELGDASTADIDTRANTIWLDGALQVEAVKTAAGELKAVAFNEITIYAKSNAARVEGNGNKQTFQVKGATVGAASTLVINNVKFAFVSPAQIKMEGIAQKKATLQINSNVKLQAVTVPTGDANNIVKDYTNN